MSAGDGRDGWWGGHSLWRCRGLGWRSLGAGVAEQRGGALRGIAFFLRRCSLSDAIGVWMNIEVNLSPVTSVI